MNFIVYATADNKLYVACGTVEGSAFATFVQNLQQCKLPWDSSKTGYKVIKAFQRQDNKGLSVILQKRSYSDTRVNTYKIIYSNLLPSPLNTL